MYKKEKNPTKKVRLLAIYNITVKNKGIASIARMLVKSYNTIKNWVLRYKKHGTDGLDDIPRSGRPKKYSDKKITDFIEQEKNGSASTGQIRRRIIEQTGVNYPDHTIRRMLHNNGYSLKTPQPVHVNKDSPEYVTAWRHRIIPWISRLKNQGFTFLVADEAIIENDLTRYRNQWSVIGSRVHRTYLGSHQNGILFGTLGYNTQTFIRMDEFKTKDSIKCVNKLLYKYDKVALLFDRAPQHMSKDMSNYIADNHDRLRVEYFPVGHPALNAVEACWNVIKRADFMDEYYKNIDERMDAAMQFVRTYRFRYDIMKFLRRNPIAIIHVNHL